MLLDEVFERAVRTKKVWMRRDGQLRQVTRRVRQDSNDGGDARPMFPIKSPRYGPKPNDNFVGYRDAETPGKSE